MWFVCVAVLRLFCFVRVDVIGVFVLLCSLSSHCVWWRVVALCLGCFVCGLCFVLVCSAPYVLFTVSLLCWCCVVWLIVFSVIAVFDMCCLSCVLI